MNKKIVSSVFASILPFSLIGHANAEEPTLYLYNWSQYMNPAVIQAFEKKYHAHVVQSYYGSLGEMFAKLQSGGDTQYDIVVPSNYFVPRLIGAGLVQKLDKSRIPNAANVSPQFLNAGYDPGLQYSLPYQWGTTGVVYDTRAFPNAKPSWSLLFDPAVNPDQPFALQPDAQGNIGIACAYLHKGSDCTSLDDWRQAAQLLLKTRQRNNFAGFVDGTPVLEQLVRGTIKIGIAYNGDFVSDKTQDPNGFKYLAFMLPEEGAEKWVDSMMIPAHAPHPDLAYKFINFILDPKIGAELSNYTYYSSPNPKALPLLKPILNQPPSLPTAAQMKFLHFYPNLTGPQLQLSQQLWSDVRSH